MKSKPTTLEDLVRIAHDNGMVAHVELVPKRRAAPCTREAAISIVDKSRKGGIASLSKREAEILIAIAEFLIEESKH